MRHGSVGPLLLLLGVLAGCDSGPKGTYSNATGMAMLDIAGGGKATMSIFGETRNCTYATADKAINLTCGADKVVFRVNSDGSLLGPAGLGVLKKSK
jgi:hypothetical protein